MIFIDLERKATVFGPEKVNEIPEPLPDEFLTPIVPADGRPPVSPDIGMCGKMWSLYFCCFVIYYINHIKYGLVSVEQYFGFLHVP